MVSRAALALVNPGLGTEYVNTTVVGKKRVSAGWWGVEQKSARVLLKTEQQNHFQRRADARDDKGELNTHNLNQFFSM